MAAGEIALTDDQITLAFQATLNHRPRPADLGILRAMGATTEVVADYIWDHWMGEPIEPSATMVLRAVQEAIR